MEYEVRVVSDSTDERVYTQTSRSALKAAETFGRCEGGEVVTVSRKCGTVISQARWTPEDGGKYYRCTI